MLEHEPDKPTEALTPQQEIRLLAQIVPRIEKLSAAGKRWLQSWLGEHA